MKRYVSTSFWDDEWVQSLSPTERYVYLYLLTNSLTNIAGVYKIPQRRIVFDTGLDENEINTITEKFKDAGKAYRHGEYIVLPSWPRHQKCQNPNIMRGIHRLLKTFDVELLAFLKEVGYCYPLDDFLTPKTAEAGQLSAPSEDEYSELNLTEEMKLFLNLWQTTKDKNGQCIFQITATIERPRDWTRFWEKSKPTAEQIETAFRNFAEGIDSGVIPRQFIPATPDRFVLKGGISRYQSPVIKEHGRTENDGGDMLADKIAL